MGLLTDTGERSVTCTAGTGRRRPRLLLLVTEDWYFCSHRIGLARYAQDAGYDVCVGMRIGPMRDQLEAETFETVDIPFERSLRRPVRDLAAYRAIVRLLDAFRPDIVHLVSLKPIIVGGIALRRHRETRSLVAFTGLGYLFSSSDSLALLLRPLVTVLLRRIVRRPQSWTLAQNTDDLALLLEAGIDPGPRASVIRGAGVDVDAYRPRPEMRAGTPVVLLPARILIDKGVVEFVEAARIVRARALAVRFVIVGAHDPDNPGAVAPETLEEWVRSGVVEWWGYRSDMPEVYPQATITCLPSYREGLPRVLLEAAACGCALVATEAPGCREICIDGRTGLSVPPRDSASLASAIARLLEDEALRARLGSNGRELVVREFSLPRIARETIELYDELLRTPRPATRAPA